MKMLEIVTHCWSGDDVPIYHRLLQMQLASLCAQVPIDFKIMVTVCLSSADQRTVDVVDWFSFYPDKPYHLRYCALSNAELFRRAIGRNKIAKTTKADVVWFTDCDYLFCGDSLSRAVRSCLSAPTPMVYPKEVHTHLNHSLGDAAIQHAETSRLALPSFDCEFYPRVMKKAIGGIQIVKGAWCREKGYLDGTDWIKSVEGAESFLRCRCDTAFRRQPGMDSIRRDIPDVYRVRHTKCGRDGGKVDHGR